MFDGEQLTYFIEAAQCLNFTDVARRHYITQPAISRKIGELEHQLGTQLFCREGHRLALTGEGALFLEEAKKIVQGMQDAAAKVERMRMGRTGHITIGTVNTSNYVLSRCLAEFYRRYPEVMVEIRMTTGGQQTELLAQGNYDFSFCDGHMIPADAEGALEYVVSGADRFCLVLPEGHPLKELPEDFSQLAGEPFAIINELDAPQLYRMTVELCQRRGYTPKVASRYNRAEAVLLSVGAGIGISVLPGNLPKFFSVDGVRYLPIAGEDCVIESVIIRQKSSANKAAEKFWEMVLELYPQP